MFRFFNNHMIMQRFSLHSLDAYSTLFILSLNFFLVHACFSPLGLFPRLTKLWPNLVLGHTAPEMASEKLIAMLQGS